MYGKINNEHRLNVGRGLSPALAPIRISFPSFTMTSLSLKTQEIPLDHPDSRCMFLPGPDKPFVATPAALSLYGDFIVRCLAILQAKARQHGGIDYLQVFECPKKPEPLWFIEDGAGGAITALLPSDY